MANPGHSCGSGWVRPGGPGPASQPVGHQLFTGPSAGFAGGESCWKLSLSWLQQPHLTAASSFFLSSRPLLQCACPVIFTEPPASAVASVELLQQGWESELRLVVDAAFPQERLFAVLGELQHSCPNTTISLSDAVLSGAEEAITHRDADVVVTTRVPSNVLGDWLLDVQMIAVAASGHPLHAPGHITVA